MTDAPTEPSKEALEAAREAVEAVQLQWLENSRGAPPEAKFYPVPINNVLVREFVALALDRFRAAGVWEWQPVETLPESVTHCWVGHAASSTMLVAYRDKLGPGEWRIMWSERRLPWAPTHWMPLPEPPHD